MSRYDLHRLPGESPKQEAMTEEEAEASMKDMSDMVDYFYSMCPRCGNERRHCSIECINSGKGDE